MSQYDVDVKGKHAKQFKSIRKLLLTYSEINELKNENQTSYSDQYGVIIMMRSKGDELVVAFGKGYLLQEKFPQLKGTGKIVRHLYFKENENVDETLLKAMINESIILGLEAYEMKKLKCNQK